MRSMQTLTLLLAALATARITLLITTDRITEAPRQWLVRKAVARAGSESLAAYLLVCNWCSSVYVGAGVAGAWWVWGEQRWFAAVCAALAFSYVAGYLNNRAGE